MNTPVACCRVSVADGGRGGSTGPLGLAPLSPPPKKKQKKTKKNKKTPQDAFAPGPGTYERAGNIYASLVGSLVRHEAGGGKRQRRETDGDEEEGDEEDDDEDDGKRQRRPVLAVTNARAPHPPLPSAATTTPLVVPRPGDVVTGRVSRVGPTTAHVALLCSGSDGRALPCFPGAAPFPGSGPAPGAFRGVVRRQDVRRTDVDGVVMRDCFRPGDVVRCAVLALGDGRAYFLSTAANELGVVAARSAAAGGGGGGRAMVPVSWQEMACPVTGAVERRKVARVGVAVDGAAGKES
jgi:exosome complex RNA-binding protein Csl4